MDIQLPSTKPVDKSTENYQECKAKVDGIIELAQDPVKTIKTAVSLSAQDLVDNDKDIKQRKNDLAHRVVSNAFDQVNATNIKDSKKTYYELNQNDIVPYGANKDTSKGQQKTLVVFSKFYWVLVMATIGFFYIVPAKTFLELFRNISFRTVEKTITKNGEETTETERKKLGIVGTIVGCIFSLAWWAGMVLLTILYPFIMLYVAIGLFAVIGIIVLLFGDKALIFKSKNKPKQIVGQNTDKEKSAVEDEKIDITNE